MQGNHGRNLTSGRVINMDLDQCRIPQQFSTGHDSSFNLRCEVPLYILSLGPPRIGRPVGSIDCVNRPFVSLLH